MRAESDTTARVVVLLLCLFIVIVRLVRPQIEFDAYSLGALALAALIAVVPVFSHRAAAEHSAAGERLTGDDVSELKRMAERAGLLMADSTGAYTMLSDTRPMSVAVSGAYATLGLRLKALTDQAHLSARGADAAGCLAMLNSAGITTSDQYEALSRLLRLLKIGSSGEFDANETLLEIAIGVIEMLDGTIG